MTAGWQISAEHVMGASNWLSAQPAAFRTEVLARSELVRTAPGEVIFRCGDPPGGMYGLISGTATLDLRTAQGEEHSIHVKHPGAWIGEVAFFTLAPRNIGWRSLTAASMLHLPLAQMHAIIAQDKRFERCFAANMIHMALALMRVAHDLQKRHPHHRVASVLGRAAAGTEWTLPQAGLARMANVSRRQASAALQTFAHRGWLQQRYRSIVVQDAAALQAFSNGEDASL